MTGNPWYRRRLWRLAKTPSTLVTKPDTPDVDPLLRRQVDAVVRSAAQTPDPRARVNQWRQTS